MRLIAHRGNFNGANKERENTLEYLYEAILKGFDVEVDIWKIGDKYFLGHDGPKEEVSLDDLEKIKHYAWFHAKNLDVLTDLLGQQMHVFFHDQDDYTLTSKGVIWAFSGKDIGMGGIACMPESTPGFEIPKNAYGVCSDDLLRFIPGAIA